MAPRLADLGRNKWVVALITSVGLFVTLLDTTIVDIVLPKMMPTLETDIYGIQWVVIAYFIGAAVSMTMVAWLAERMGHRNCYLVGLGTFVLVSALCGAANSLEFMIAARLLQGAAEGLVVPVGLLILYDAFPAEQRGLALGVFALGGVFAPAVGPSLGGYITEHLSWRWVFYVNVPIGVVDVLLIGSILANRRAEPQQRHGPPAGVVERRHAPPLAPRLDLVGLVLLSCALSSLVVALTKGQQLGWLQSDLILGLTLACALTLAAFVAREVFAADPLIPRALFRRRTFVVALVGNAVSTAVLYGVFFLLPLYLENLRGQTALQAGLLLAPGSVAAAFGTLIGGVLADRLRPKWVAIFGLAATVWLTWHFRLGLDVPLSAIASDYLFWGLMGTVFAAPVNLLAIAAVRKEDIPHATMLINVLRFVGGSVGTAYMTNVLTSRGSAFYSAIASRIEWGSHAGRELAARLGALTGGGEAAVFNPDAFHGTMFIGQSLLQAVAVAEAFGVTMKHLALICLAAAAVTLLARDIKGQGVSMGH
jgi:MFS transporter, DHA2 family, multidrug resistance protein